MHAGRSRSFPQLSHYAQLSARRGRCQTESVVGDTGLCPYWASVGSLGAHILLAENSRALPGLWENKGHMDDCFLYPNCSALILLSSFFLIMVPWPIIIQAPYQSHPAGRASFPRSLAMDAGKCNLCRCHGRYRHGCPKHTPAAFNRRHKTQGTQGPGDVRPGGRQIIADVRSEDPPGVPGLGRLRLPLSSGQTTGCPTQPMPGEALRRGKWRDQKLFSLECHPPCTLLPAGPPQGTSP